ncbi:MAG: replicative DNA helicase, partial [Clostridiales bacterium]|nr:replicative DNA helicase [Clostridiales bacterium]
MADFNSINNYGTIDISNISMPNNLDAEQSVLGAVLLDSEVMAILADKLQPESFYMELHGQLYSLMLNMFLSGSRIDIVTVLDQSLKQNIFETQEEAKKYLAKLMEVVPSVSTVDKYAEIVEEKHLVRKLILVSKEIYDLAANSGESSQNLLDFAEQKIYDIRSNREIKGLVHISGVVMEKMKELSKLSEAEGADNITGLRTGFSALDNYIFGLNKSDLILIAARPGMGKTSFVMNMATNVARKYDKKIAVFSLEMSKEQLVGRMLSSEASITSDQMKTGKINRQDWARIGEAADILSKMSIYLDDSAAVTVGSMKAKLRRMKNLGLVVIDYLQLMQSNRRTDNRVAEISEITRNLKIIAKELNVP